MSRHAPRWATAGGFVCRRAALCALALLLCVQATTATASELTPHAVAGAGDRVPSLRVEPSTVILGRTSRVNIEISVSEEVGEPPLRGSVNVGSLGEIEQVEPGLYRTSYRPPNARFPQVAVIAFWRETGPDATVSFFRLPLLGTASVPVETSLGATINVNLQGRTFGPFEAGEDGRAVARLVVPPGVTQATVTALAKDGSTTSQSLDLGVPPYNRLTLALVPHIVTADGVSLVRLHLYFDDTGRRPPSARSFRIATPLEATTPVEHVSGPLFLAEFVAPPGTPDGDASFGASLRGDRASRGRASVNVGQQVLSSLAFETTSVSGVADGNSPVELRLFARDELGLGIAGLPVEVSPAPESLVESVEVIDEGLGQYLIRFVPVRLDAARRTQSVRVPVSLQEYSAEAVVELGPWVPAEIEAEIADETLRADGISETSLVVRAFDAAGRPMDHLTPSARASAGKITGVTALEEGGFSVGYLSPILQVRVSGDDAEPAARSEMIRVAVGDQVIEVPISLIPSAAPTWEPRIFVEAAGGLQSNLGALIGPMVIARGGLWITELGPVDVGGGIWTGLAFSSGRWELGADRVARVRLVSMPLLAEAWAKMPVGGWRVTGGLGLGLTFAPGTVMLPESEPVKVGSVMPSFGLRAGASRPLADGRLIFGLQYLHARRSDHRGIVDVTGQVGGLGLTVGYGVEL